MAVKKLLISHLDESLMDEFRREASTMEHLGNHPNIISFLGACTKQPNICLVTNFCSLGSLYDLLVRQTCLVFWLMHWIIDCEEDEASLGDSCWYDEGRSSRDSTFALRTCYSRMWSLVALIFLSFFLSFISELSSSLVITRYLLIAAERHCCKKCSGWWKN